MSEARREAVKKARVLHALIAIAEVDIILSTFVSAFVDKTIPKQDLMVYLHGNFNIGGTVSGRLSSSSVNLQNLPSSGSKYAKHVKECFAAPSGFLMMGADFNALEAKIGALLTQDPNKLKIYTEGYDAHSVNAYGYWPNKFKDIQQVLPNTGVRTFSVSIDGQEHYLLGGTPVECPDGNIMAIEDYYAKCGFTGRET